MRDDLRRHRATALFRWVLALPHFVWWNLWAGAMFLLAPVMWLMTLVTGRPNEGLREVYALFLRYTVHVTAYAWLAAEPYPGFLGRPGYPVDLLLPPPERQRRWSVALRGVLALPPLLFTVVLGSAMVTGLAGALAFSPGLGGTALVLGWFATVATARMPPGLRDAVVWPLGYAIQVLAYATTVTGAFPHSDPRQVELAPRPRHPVRLQNTDELRRHRLLVGFRFPLIVPHVAWSTLWALVALPAALVAWLAALVTGRVPAPLHRFLAAYVRYAAHVNAFLYLAGGPFPGFAGAAGSYPVDLELAPAERQHRATVAFRWLLGLPAFLLASAVSGILTAGAVGAWWFALVTGRMPRGLHPALAYGVRYTGQAMAYALLVTGAYPHSGPSEEEPAERADLLLVAPERPIGAP